MGSEFKSYRVEVSRTRFGAVEVRQFWRNDSMMKHARLLRLARILITEPASSFYKNDYSQNRIGALLELETEPQRRHWKGTRS